MRISRELLASVLIALVLFASTGLLLYRLGVEPFQDYDEATYAEVSAESLATHHFLSFTFLDQNYFNKPPLLFWLMDVSKTFVPNAQTAARLPSALSAILLIAGVMLLAYEASKNLFIAGLAGAILATTSSYIEPARQARFDILVSLFNMAAVYAFLKSMNDRRWFLAYGAFIGLAVLSKGPIAFYAIIASLGIATAYKRINWLWDPYFWGGVGVSLLIAAPWHVYETIRFGYAFWEEYLADQIVDRVGQMLFNGPTNADYVAYLIGFASPWIEVFCASVLAGPFLWKRMSQKVRAVFLASVVGAFAVLAVCVISKTKAISYLIPLYPFMAVAISLVVFELSKIKLWGTRTILTIGLICLISYGFYLSIYNGFHINPYYNEEVSLADQEKVIGDTLFAAHPNTFYVYDTTTVGSIMFYSRLVTPEWLGTTPPPSGGYMLFPSNELNKIEQAYPATHITVVYAGTYLTLGVAD